MPTIEAKKSSGWIDSHCHLNEISELSKHLFEASKQHIDTFVLPGTSPEQWQETLGLQCSGNLHRAYGIHPWFVVNPTQELKALELWLQEHSAIAIGEVGLDYYPSKQVRPAHRVQREAFEGQLALAKQFDLPIILHCVKAHNDVLTLLRKYKIRRGVVHAFTGSKELAQAYVDQGLYIGVGPIILKSQKTLNAVNHVSIERLVLETDAPFMATGQSEQQNPLLDLISVAEKLAKQCAISTDELQQITRSNSQQLFNL